MRQITIVHIEFPDHSSVYIKRKQYSVCLGNGSRTYHSTYKLAKRFMAETNRFLNDRLHELNYLYANIFSEYRKIWFYFKGVQNADTNIINCFNETDGYFVKVVTRGNTPNANSFIYGWIFSICDALNESIQVIKDILKGQKYYADLRRVEMIERQVLGVKEMLEKYGK